MPLKSRDHHVPRMYLRRFGSPTSHGHQVTTVTPDLQRRFTTSITDVAVERGFYWGTDIDGVPHHDLEDFLTSLEGDAATAFRRVLDTGKNPTDDALPPWPPRTDVRQAISWWMAAQILRTLRQRQRLDVQHRKAHADDKINIPRQFDSANRHIRYIAEMVEQLAAAIYLRPWGVGISDYCLLTGDVPVLVLNGQDHPNQDAAIRYWDLYMPMDPHRCLYLPGQASTDDRRLRRDHRFKLHAGHALGLNSMLIDTAVRHVFHHPAHDPTSRAQPAVDSGDQLPTFHLLYDVLPTGYGVERRWLDTHPESTAASVQPCDDIDPATVAAQLMKEMQKRADGFVGQPE